MTQNRKMKIGFFMDDFYPSINGVNFVMDQYARTLGDSCDFVFVVPVVDKNYTDDFPYKVIRVKGVWTKAIGYTWATPAIDFKARKAISDEHFDLIHIHSPFVMGRLGVRFARKHHIPVVGTIHTRFNYELDRLHLRGICKQIPMNWIMRTFNLCDECFTVNEAIKEIFVNLGVTNQISLIPNATEFVTSETPEEDRAFIERKYQLKKEDRVLLFVGRINIVKNLVFLIESLKALQDRGTDFKMLFIGPVEDEKIFYDKIRDLGIEDRVLVCGKIYDRELLKKIYVRADLLLFPSYYDTSSLVQVEAASQFTPTVFIENSPTASNVTNDVNGFITRSDSETYAEKIAEVLEDRELYEKVSRGCHDSLYITWREACEKLLEKYRKYV